jgi:hypothetical protein
MKLAIDISKYDDLTQTDWDVLCQVINGVIIRTWFGADNIDTAAAGHVAECKKRGMPYASYGWVDITEDLDAQVAKCKQAVSMFTPASMFMDYEQYWTDWDAYMRQDLATCYKTRMSPSGINTFNQSFHSKISKALTIPVGQYSADWFINEYSPAMRPWVTAGNYWEARYMRYYDATYLAGKKKEWGIPFPVQNVLELAKQAYIYKGIGRQFESLLEIQGLGKDNYNLDWNVITDEAFSRMFGVAYVPDPNDPPVESKTTTYTVAVDAAWIRETPMGTKIGYKFRGESVIGDQVINGWVHLVAGGWMSLSVLVQAGNLYRVIADFLWVRDAPWGVQLRWLKAGDTVNVNKVVQGWGEISVGEWVSMKYLVSA